MFQGSAVRQSWNNRTAGTHGTAVDDHRRGVGAPNGGAPSVGGMGVKRHWTV
jgi:hypothetical protein